MGTTDELTCTVIVAEEAHCPVIGVKVYTVDPADAVLIGASQVPEILFRDMVGKIPGIAPGQ